MRYAAFLRAVNVGGNNIVSMKALCQKLGGAGFENIQSYKQSGNLVFDFAGPGKMALERLKGVLKTMLSKDIEVYLRSAQQMKAIVAANPFKKSKLPPGKQYVVLTHQPLPKLKLPHKSPKGDAEILLSKGGDTYCLASPVQGSGGAPAQYIESAFKLPATGRNWLTITALAQALEGLQKA